MAQSDIVGAGIAEVLGIGDDMRIREFAADQRRAAIR